MYRDKNGTKGNIMGRKHNNNSPDAGNDLSGINTGEGYNRAPSSTLNPRNSQYISELRGFSENTGTKPGQNDDNLFSLQSGLYESLQEFCKEKKIMYIVPRPYVDFRPPKLNDTGKCWYVFYSVKNPETGKFKRFRKKVNQGTIKERRAAAREIMASLSQQLLLGWSPFASGPNQKGVTPAFEVFSIFEKVKEKEMEKQSIASYKSFIRAFKRFLEGAGFSERTLITSIDRDVARGFMDYLEADGKISPATYNNYLSFMVTFFGWIQKRGYIRENVFDGFERKPKKLTKKKRRAMNDEEVQSLFSFLANENLEYLAICILCYCCFIRPKEISLLKCRDIDLERQTVHVSEEIAKNDNESYRTIPTAAMPLFRRLDLSHPEWFLFGGHVGNSRDFTPGRTPTSNKKIWHFWDKVVEPKCNFGDGVSFYSLKDTGITKTLSEGVSLNYVQQQADHSSPSITGIYVGKTAEAIEVLKGIDILPDSLGIDGRACDE